MKKQIKSILLFSFLGAVVSTLCDLNHAYTGALSYPRPFFYIQPWWSFPGFTLAFFTMAIVYLKLTAVFSHRIKFSAINNRDIKPFIEAFIIYTLAYLMSGFAWKFPALLSVILYSTFFIRLSFTYERFFIFIIAIILAAGGVFGEGILVKLNLVVYKNPQIFGVPWWLGAIYMHGAMALREGIKFIVLKEE